MKRPRKTTLLGLVILTTLILADSWGCRRRETSQLEQINRNLEGIQASLRDLGKDLGTRSGRNIYDFPTIFPIKATLSAAPPAVQVNKGQIHLMYSLGHQIAWSYQAPGSERKPPKMKIEFKVSDKNPFNVACGTDDDKGLSFCLSGPIINYSNGDQCDPLDKQARCFDYRVCLELSHGNWVCTADPGIIIHP